MGVLHEETRIRDAHVRAVDGQASYAEQDGADRLREDAEHYRALLTALDDGFCVIDLIFDAASGRPVDYRFVDLNAQFEQHTGLVDAAGRTARELVPHLDEFWYEVYGRVAVTGEPARFERYEPSMQRAFEVHATRVGRPERRRVAVLFRDVTERRRTEISLHREEARFQKLFESNLLGLFFWHRDGRVYDANDSLLRMIGYDRGDLAAGRVDWVRMTPAEHRENDERALAALVTTGRHAPLEKEWFRKEGSRVWVLLASAMLDADTGVSVAIDVSRQKETEAALRASEQRAHQEAARAESERAILDAILDAAPAAIILAEANGRIVRVNAANERLWGPVPFSESVDEYVEWKGWWADGSERHGRRVEPHDWAMSRALRGEPPRDDIVEIEPFDRPGTRRTMVNRGAPVRDAEGNVKGAIIAQMDISALVAAEASRREAEAKFRALADNIAQLAWMADEAGALTWYNRRWFEFTGTTFEEMEGWGWRAVHHPDHVERVTEKFKRHVASGEPWEDTFPLRRADGVYRWFLSRAVPTRDEAGRVTLWCGTNTDITEQREVEEALRKSQQLLRTTMDNFPTVIAFKDREGRFLDVNGVVESVLGVPKDQIVGKTIGDFVPQEAAAVLEAHEREVMETRRAQQFEETTPLGTGTLHHLNTNFPLVDPDGNVYGTGHISHDVTLQKRAEAAVRAVNERLQEADRRKDEFIAILAHELRNPLAPVRNAVEVLRRVGPAEPRLERVHAVIDRQVTHMARLIDDLLDVSRIARGKLTLHKESCDLAEIVRLTAEDYRASLDAAGVTLVVAPTPEPLWVEGDPVRLAQMTGNLLHNAARFTEKGGRVEVRSHADRANRLAIVEIVDDGVGMDPALLSRLFDPFSQADQDLARSKGGLGLGLALTKGLAELHGGGVAAQSEGTGRGSTFTLRIPLSKARYQAASSDRAATRKGDGVRVLVVEDNEDAAETLSALLELGGYTVSIAFDGVSAVAIARTFRPHVIISDLGLPGALDGYGVARTLRGEPEFEDVYFVALSGYANEDARRRSRDAGFDAHLAKPPDIARLERMLAEVGGR